jgi:hypothetical protein
MMAATFRLTLKSENAQAIVIARKTNKFITHESQPYILTAQPGT